MSRVIELIDIRQGYTLAGTRYDVLKGINFAIEEGELVAIMGSSGAGKTTLMNIIGLLDKPASGEYHLDGIEAATLNDDERSLIRNRKIGFVFQGFFLLPRLNALENVGLPLFYRNVSQHDAKAPSLEGLEKVGMGDFANRKPNELSGGQQQRVAIARALVGKPAVILADEPTGALDHKTGQSVMDLFKKLNKDDRVTTIIVTHDPKIAAQCDRTISLRDGLVVDHL